MDPYGRGVGGEGGVGSRGSEPAYAVPATRRVGPEVAEYGYGGGGRREAGYGYGRGQGGEGEEGVYKSVGDVRPDHRNSV